LGPLRETFPFGSYEKVTPGNPTNYTGQKISCGTGTFSIGNSHYTSKIKVSPISPGRDMSSEFLERTLDGKSCWEKQLGMLRWAARNRPDIAYDLSIIFSVTRPIYADVARPNKLVRTRHHRADLQTTFLQMPGEKQLVVYCDSSFKGRPDEESQIGYAIYLCNLASSGVKMAIPLRCGSYKQVVSWGY